MSRLTETVVVIAGGDPPTQDVAARLPASRSVIAADSGLDAACELDLRVDLVVGDLDSVSAASLEWARSSVERSAVPIEQYPKAKDATDLELALDAALARRPERLIVLGIGGGRLDHLLGNLTVIASERYGPMSIEAWPDDRTIITVIRDRLTTLSGRSSDLVSLLPILGDAVDVTTSGLLFELDHGTLPGGQALGISNEFVGDEATVHVGSGVLLAIQPGEPGVLGAETSDAMHPQSSAKRSH